MEVFILSAHLIVILFMIIGFPVGLIANNRRFRIFHAGALAFVTLLMIFQIPCPLTVLEEFYAEKSYEGSFIASWLNRIVYMRWFDAQSVFVIDVFFALLVFSSFFWRPIKNHRTKNFKNKIKEEIN